MWKHVVESAERFGEHGEIRGGGGDRCVREARSIEVGTGMLGDAVGGAAGRPEANWKLTICAPLGRMVGVTVDWGWRDGDGCDGDVERGRGGGMEQRGELVVVEKIVVALKVTITIVFHCCAR